MAAGKRPVNHESLVAYCRCGPATACRVVAGLGLVGLGVPAGPASCRRAWDGLPWGVKLVAPVPRGKGSGLQLANSALSVGVPDCTPKN